MTVAFGETGNIQPVSAPAFAVRGRSQQPVNQSFVSVRRIIVREVVNVSRTRRKPEQIERQSPDQRTAIRDWHGLYSTGKLPFGENRIDRIANCDCVVCECDTRHHWSHDRLKGPVVTLDRLRRQECIVPCESVVHPASQFGDFGFREWWSGIGGRHPVVAGSCQNFNEAAGRSIAGSSQWLAGTFAEYLAEHIEPDAGLRIRSRVALETS